MVHWSGKAFGYKPETLTSRPQLPQYKWAYLLFGSLSTNTHLHLFRRQIPLTCEKQGPNGEESSRRNKCHKRMLGLTSRWCQRAERLTSRWHEIAVNLACGGHQRPDRRLREALEEQARDEQTRHMQQSDKVRWKKKRNLD